MRILIADDEVTIARALKLLLERNKYAVDIVHTGTDALDYIMATDYDAIVLDIMMPETDGFHVLRKIREESQIPVIIISAKIEQQLKNYPVD